MLPQLMSPRLPGVIVLPAEATGPEFRRWRRGVETAFKANETWGHCDGSNPMPMPESGPNFFSPVVAQNPQPQLLEERRAWVKKDRDVKLDIFLSVADDIKLEVFDVGPPMPPAAMTAKEMLEALEDHFSDFNFEEYHHIFCHFLNLHIDQFASVADFNTEFLATLEDLLDQGHPMSNVQACSAYFSKLRCTQNPWVAKKLRHWDSQRQTPQLADLMKECPSWMMIRPLSTRPASQKSVQESFSEELVGEDSQDSSSSSSESEDDTEDNKDEASETLQTITSPKSLEITVHASVEDLSGAIPMPLPQSKVNPKPVPPRLSSKKSLATIVSPPLDRPLPPLPKEALSTERIIETVIEVKSTSASPRLSIESPKRPSTSSGTAPSPRRLSNEVVASSLPPRPSSSQALPSPNKFSTVFAPLVAQPSVETFTTWPPLQLQRSNSSSSSVLSLPLQGATIPSPKPKDTDLTRDSALTLVGSGSPSLSIGSSTHSRQSSWDEDDEEKKKGRIRIGSWKLKARLNARREIKEII